MYIICWLVLQELHCSINPRLSELQLSFSPRTRREKKVTLAHRSAGAPGSTTREREPSIARLIPSSFFTFSLLHTSIDQHTLSSLLVFESSSPPHLSRHTTTRQCEPSWLLQPGSAGRCRRCLLDNEPAPPGPSLPPRPQLRCSVARTLLQRPPLLGPRPFARNATSSRPGGTRSSSPRPPPPKIRPSPLPMRKHICQAARLLARGNSLMSRRCLSLDLVV